MSSVRPPGGRLPAGCRSIRSRLPAALLLALACGALAGRTASAQEPGAPAVAALRDAEPRGHDPARASCADCHATVAGEERSTAAAPAGARAANAALLRAADPVDLCLSCHDGQPGIPDVLGPDVNGLADRSAGFFAGLDAPTGRGHAIGRGGGLRAGGDRLACTDCHDPHGNHVARNLRRPGDRAATPLGLFVDPAATGLRRYESSSVSYGTLDDDRLREVSLQCLDCHSDQAESRATSCGGRPAWSHHPSYDSSRGAANTIAQGVATGATDAAHWERGQGAGFLGTARVPVLARGADGYREARTVEAGRSGVFCLSCHRAHGSAHASGLRWESRGPVAASGCEQCHDMARDGPAPLAAERALVPALTQAVPAPAGFSGVEGAQPSFAPVFFSSSR
jgi:hypothetical protein